MTSIRALRQSDTEVKEHVITSSPGPELDSWQVRSAHEPRSKPLSAFLTVLLMIVQACCAGLGAVGVLLAQFSYDACAAPSRRCDFSLGNTASVGYFVIAGALLVGSVVLLVVKRSEWHRMWPALLGGIFVLVVVFGVTLTVIDTAAA